MCEVKCPACKKGHLVEDIPGGWCSRRYAKKNPCDFVIGEGQSVESALKEMRERKVLQARLQAETALTRALLRLLAWVDADRGHRKFQVEYRGRVRDNNGRWSRGYSVRLYADRKGGWLPLTYVGPTLEQAAEKALENYAMATAPPKYSTWMLHKNPLRPGEHIKDAHGQVAKVERVTRTHIYTRRREHGEYYDQVASWTEKQFFARKWWRTTVRPLRRKS